jgi:uncharacterized membrane protein YfhO
VRLERYAPDELAFAVEAPSDGWLLVTDRWARGWTAEVNGRPSTVYGGAFLFRAVEVRAGGNHIRMVYDPYGVRPLVVASWGTLLVVAAWSFASAWRRARIKAVPD